MAIYNPSFAPFGILLRPPTVINPPPGWVFYKLKMRSDHFTTAVFRRGRSVAIWSLRFVDEAQAHVEPLVPLSANIYPDDSPPNV